MTILGYAILVFVADLVYAVLVGWYLDLRVERRVRAAVFVGALLTVVGGLNIMSFIKAGWWMLVASVAGATLGDWLSFFRWRNTQ